MALAPGQVLEVGRAPECGFVLPHATVSRLHAVVRASSTGVELENRSTNGSYVDGEPVGTRQLRPGDRVAMGVYEVVFTTAPPEPGDAEATQSLEVPPDLAAPPEPEPAPAPAAPAIDRSDVFYGADSQLLVDDAGDDADAEPVAAGAPLESGAPRFLAGASGRSYVLETELGRGGQGVVYLARVEGERAFPGFANPVEYAVVKMAREGAPTARDQLLAEEAVYARPDPGLVSLLDRGEKDGAPFLVLERLFPHPFSRGARPVEAATAVDTFVNLLEVLHRLHTRREGPLVLCDIKPDNVMVRLSSKEGDDPIRAAEYERRLRGRSYEPVFMDMGCAQDRTLLNARGGRLKDVVGTAAYLPPESLPRPRGDDFLPGVYSDKTDVYALTLTLYQLLTGDRPYEMTGLHEASGQEFLLALLELKRDRGVSPIREEVVRERLPAGDAAAVLEVLRAGLAQAPDLRLSARDLLRLAKRELQVGEARVLNLSDYAFDAVHGVHLEQRRFSQGVTFWAAG